jgi:hypothetical protein
MYFPFGMTVTVNHRQIDRNGDYQITDSYQLPGCVISYAGRAGSARGSEQESFERDTIRASTVLFAPTGADIRVNDTITLDDNTTWHVWGLPTDFRSPFTGWAPGKVAALRLYEG